MCKLITLITKRTIVAVDHTVMETGMIDGDNVSDGDWDRKINK